MNKGAHRREREKDRPKDSLKIIKTLKRKKQKRDAELIAWYPVQKQSTATTTTTKRLKTKDRRRRGKDALMTINKKQKKETTTTAKKAKKETKAQTLKDFIKSQTRRIKERIAKSASLSSTPAPALSSATSSYFLFPHISGAKMPDREADSEFSVAFAFALFSDATSAYVI